MKGPHIAAMLDGNPNREFALVPSEHATYPEKVRGLVQGKGGTWTYAGLTYLGKWQRKQGTVLSRELLPVEEAEKLIADRKQVRDELHAQYDRVRAVVALLTAKGVAARALGVNVVVQDADGLRRLIESKP